MKILNTLEQLKEYLYSIKNTSLGFVPTMGCIHNGHLALLQQSQKENTKSIVSIFVNPTQFNNIEDFKLYPKTLEKDIQILQEAKCDALFCPNEEEIYPKGNTENKKHYSLGYVENILEGQYRPNHFKGVCQIVDILLSHIKPHNLYLGKKDYQQCLILKQMINEYFPQIQIHFCETRRDKNGLAISSRNFRLTEQQQYEAKTIFSTLQETKKSLINSPKNFSSIIAKYKQTFEQDPYTLDYFELRDKKTLEPLKNKKDIIHNGILLIAVHFYKVRLIDNLALY